ncbi:MAG: SCO family protein [Planctomycetaceae bacterium]|nr:SCO family protein [Planctomycetaceae bacterium]
MELKSRMEDVPLTPKFGASLPMDAKFTDSNGKPVTLGEFFPKNGTKPVLLTFNFSNCKAFCSDQLNALAKSLKDASHAISKDFIVLTVCIDPKEGVERAKGSKDRFVNVLGREGADEGWRFFVGEEAQTRKLADAVGYGYKQDEQTGEWLHKLALMVCTPDGRVSNYLHYYPTAEEIDGAIDIASRNEISSRQITEEEADGLFASCIKLLGGENASKALAFARLFGIVIMLGLIGYIGYWYVRGRKPAAS